MSDRRTTPSAAGDDDPTPARGSPTATSGAMGHEGADGWDDDEWDEPNYLVRRALVVAVVVAAIAVAAIVISRFIGSDGSSNPTSSAAADWNTIVVLDGDQIRLLDRDSTEEIEAFSASDDLLDVQSLVAGNVLVTVTDEGRITQTDLDDGSTRRGRAGLDETLRITPDHPSIAVVGPDTGGDVTIIDLQGSILFEDGDLEFRNAVASSLESGRQKLIINMAEVPYVDSAGLSELVRGFVAVNKRGGRMVLLDLTRKVADLLTVAKLFTIFEAFESEEDAIGSLGSTTAL